MTTAEPPPWRYRFANYRRAFLLLREALEEDDFTQLERWPALGNARFWLR